MHENENLEVLDLKVGHTAITGIRFFFLLDSDPFFLNTHINTNDS